MKKKEIRKLVLSFVFALAIYGVLSYAINSGMIGYYESSLLTLTCINIVLATSLNLASGYLGQLTLGHAGFMAVGAYVSSLLGIHLGLPLFVCLVAGGLASGAVGVLIGMPTLRLKGDYLCIITLAFNEIIRVILLNLKITNGAKGLMGMPGVIEFDGAFLSVIITIYVIYAIVKSRHGRAIISIKEDEIASELTGINVTYYKILAFAISAIFAGLAGGLYAHYMGMLVPKSFDYNKSVEILVMVVLGGLGNLKGSVIAAIVLTILPEMLREFSDYRMLLYAIVLIATMIFKETKILEKFKDNWQRKHPKKEVAK